MKKIQVILRNEIVTILSRTSFWLATLGIPLVAGLVFGGVSAINESASGAQAVSQIVSGPTEILPEGYVDSGGLIQAIPETVPAGTFLAFKDETAARKALADHRITAFYIVPKDYIQEGKVYYIRPDFNPLATDSNQSSIFRWVVQVNLAGGDWLLANLVNNPLDLQDVSLAPAGSQGPDENNPLALWTPYIVTLVFFSLIMGSSSLLLSNVSKEKENRVIETLLTSVTPVQLLTGKIVGMGVVGLGQTALWLGSTYFLLNLSGKVFHLPSEIHLPISFIIWGVLFFVLGYAVYASLMAGLGALAPNMREASQVTIVVMLPLIIPLFFSSSVFATDPHGPIATVLSIFPLSAPVAMMARLASGGVPWWQLTLTVLLLAGTAVFIVRAVARMFRAQALLSGQPIKIKTYLQALFGRG